VRGLKLLVIMLMLAGCSYQTAGSPKGGLVLTADFDDAQNLVVGHSVQISDVRIGTVTGITAVGSGTGYRARATLSLKRGIAIPVNTTAQLSITSLLGENYVQLVPPPTGLNVGPFLPDHGQISSTTVLPAFEQVVGRAGPLIAAISGNDIHSIVETGATAFAGKGPQLQKMIGQTSQLLALFADQRGRLDDAITNLARLGHDLAKHEATLKDLPATLAKTTRMLSDERFAMLDTIAKLTKLAKTMNDTVLLGRTDQLRRILTELGPVTAALADDKSNLGGLITSLQNYVEKVPRSIYNGQLLLYTVQKLSFGSAKKTDPLSRIAEAMGARR
jgi:phospholipid/cholesterol/gamma-HCH transport system substrate-binding protein